MQVIPVIDLKNGLAVHAVRGQRELYRPLESQLSVSAEPGAVLAGLLAFHPFKAVYVADLDALTGTGSNCAIVHRLAKTYPDLELWVDRGWPEGDPARPPNLLDVLGSESLAPDHLAALPRWQERAILSLDFFGECFAGPTALLHTPELWPRRVILMTLARVGSHAGPDWSRLEESIARFPRTRWIAAGGVRHAGDLRRLADMGVHATLIATALHHGYINGADLETLHPPKNKSVQKDAFVEDEPSPH